MWDATINVGTVIQIVTLIFGGFWFVTRLENKISLVANELKTVVRDRDEQHRANLDRFREVDEQLKSLVHVTIQLAEFKVRTEAIDQRINILTSRLDIIINGKTPTRRSNRG